MDPGHSISLELGPWILTALRLVHFAGLILGIGAATLLDLIIFRFVLIRRIEESHIRIILFSSSVIAVGLTLLWLSGIGFFIYYGFYTPFKIFNPKLLAKVLIVMVLTVNAYMVHAYALPQIRAQIGVHLLEGLSRGYVALLVFVGTLSAISWYVPLILGIVPQFNNTVPAEVILASYAALVLTVNVIVQLALVVTRQLKANALSLDAGKLIGSAMAQESNAHMMGLGGGELEILTKAAVDAARKAYESGGSNERVRGQGAADIFHSGSTEA